MKNAFKKPYIEIININDSDIITTSSLGGDKAGYTPIDFGGLNFENEDVFDLFGKRGK